MARGKSTKLLASIPDKYRPDFIESLDRRTNVSEAIRGRLHAIESDMGGTDSLTHARRSLIRRTVWLEAIVESYEQNLAAGAEIDLGAYTQAINTLLGLFRLLGLERKAKPARRLREHLEAVR